MPKTGVPGGRYGGREALDNNATHLPAAPEASTSPAYASQDTNAQLYTGGYVPDNATNRPAAPPAVDEVSYQDAPLVQYPGGGPTTNVTRGPDQRDEAIDRAKGLT